MARDLVNTDGRLPLFAGAEVVKRRGLVFRLPTSNVPGEAPNLFRFLDTFNTPAEDHFLSAHSADIAPYTPPTYTGLSGDAVVHGALGYVQQGGGSTDFQTRGMFIMDPDFPEDGGLPQRIRVTWQAAAIGSGGAVGLRITGPTSWGAGSGTSQIVAQTFTDEDWEADITTPGGLVTVSGAYTPGEVHTWRIERDETAGVHNLYRNNVFITTIAAPMSFEQDLTLLFNMGGTSRIHEIAVEAP